VYFVPRIFSVDVLILYVVTRQHVRKEDLLDFRAVNPSRSHSHLKEKKLVGYFRVSNLNPLVLNFGLFS